MSSTFSRRRRHVRHAATAAVLALAAAVAPAAAEKPDAPDVPERIQPPSGHRPYLRAHAVGLQIYTCDGPAWRLVAPDAELFDAKGKSVMTHYAGPSWEARDGSRVVGARVDGVNVDPTAIDLLLLRADKTYAGAYGDKLVKTTYIQRINTSGGRPPAAPCIVGDTVQIPYEADYVFWR